MKSTTAICTIVAKNYLPYARVLMASVKRHNPEILRVVILTDKVDGYFDPAQEDFEIISSEELQIPNSKWFHFKYTILELSTAVKPYALEFLIRRYDLQKIIYLDPDIKLYESLQSVEDHLEAADILLTPHLTGTLDDGKQPSELDILRSGAYNLGFIGIRVCENTFGFLHWWQDRLYDHCVVDLAHGLFVDQRWVDLVPGLFPNVRILRDPGYNVAYWNLPHRRIERRGSGWTANGEPLCFFHFSGFDPDNPGRFSRHQNRFRLATVGEVRQLVSEYRRDLLENGYATCKKWPYAYGFFENGFEIPDIGRPVHHESPHIFHQVEDPFSEQGFQAFVKLWNEPLDGPDGRPSGMTRLAYRIYCTRADVQSIMPDVFGVDQLSFLDWILTSGRREHGVHEVFLAPIWDAHKAVRQQRRKAESGGHDAATGFLPRLRRQIATEETAADAWTRLTAAGAQPTETSLNALVAGGEAGFRLTRLARYIYETRPDVQQRFPDPCGGDGPGFLLWLLTYGRAEHQLSETYLRPLREQWRGLLEHLGNPFTRLWYRFRLAGQSAYVRGRANWTRSVSRLRSASLFRRYRGRRTGEDRRPPGRRSSPQSPYPELARFGREDPGALGFNLIGYVKSEMGVGESARCAVRAAEAGGLAVRVLSLRSTGPHREGSYRFEQSGSAPLLPVNVFFVNADQTGATRETLGPELLAGRYNIGYWAWELEEFPDCWQEAFEGYQEIWTPSRFCVEAISRKSPVPVLRMPHAIDVRIERSRDLDYFGIPADRFVFLTMFDMLSVFERKNPLAVVEAFIRAFGNGPDCHLVVKVNNGGQRPDKMELLGQACAGYPIRILEETLSRNDTNALLNCADCFVSLHRSEGFGLAIAEAMYLGKPVIATGYSGNLDFTRPDNSFLVGYQLVPVGPGCEPYDEHSHWAEPVMEEAVRQLRTVYREQDVRRQTAAAGRRFLRNHFSPPAVGGLIGSRLREISSRFPSTSTPSPP